MIYVEARSLGSVRGEAHNRKFGLFIVTLRLPLRLHSGFWMGSEFFFVFEHNFHFRSFSSFSILFFFLFHHLIDMSEIQMNVRCRPLSPPKL